MTYLVGLATVAAALGGFVVAGSAFGSEWTSYAGRVSAGQAYLMEVPEGADALQIEFQPGLLASGEAKATLFSPADERVGHYVLDAENPSVLVEAPDEGGYVLYVFDVRGGVLTASVKADGADELELVTLETFTENLEIASQDSAGAFRAVDTVTLEREPVFESLLYQGSAVNLSGSVRSLAGETITVSMETGTAHGPGLFTSQAGERATFPANFAAGLHTIDVVADEFEGTLFLTTVNYLRVDAPPVDEAVPEEVLLPANAIELERHEAIGLTVAGPGILDLGIAFAPDEEEHEEHEGDAPDAGPHDWDHDEHYARLAVYDTDDELLAFLDLDGESPLASVELAEGGEYVVFLYGRDRDSVAFAALQGGTAFDEVRHLRVTENKVVLDDIALPIGYEETFTVDVEKAPLAAGLAVDGETAMAMDLRGVIHTDAGEVETHHWSFPSGPFWRFAHAHYAGEELVTGTWTIDVEATTAMGELALYTLDYLREPAEESATHEH